MPTFSLLSCVEHFSYGHCSYGVSGDYFGVMGFTLLAGRFLAAEDSDRKGRTCVVDEDFARYNWSNRNPVGQRLFQGSQPGSPSEALTVLGVVDPIKQAGLTHDTAQGAVYYPYTYQGNDNLFVALRLLAVRLCSACSAHG